MAYRARADLGHLVASVAGDPIRDSLHNAAFAVAPRALHHLPRLAVRLVRASGLAFIGVSERLPYDVFIPALRVSLRNARLLVDLGALAINLTFSHIQACDVGP
jgi:hypothetical protein